MIRRTRCQAYRRTDGGGDPAAAAFTHGRNSRKPDSTKKIGTPISARASARP
jgi:hypothetical protein